MSERIRKITIGTRGSMLAMAQTKAVEAMLKEVLPGVEITIKTIKTSGDKWDKAQMAQLGGEGLFTKEIERTLLEKEIDIAVHSLKDLPTDISEGLIIAAVPAREDAHDVLVSKDGKGLDELPQGAAVGTGSPRRKAHLLAYRADLNIVPLRGNVNTRLKKLGEHNLDAIILASAGLKRLGLEDLITETIDFSIVLPAAGQGFLAIQTRENDKQLNETLKSIEDSNARLASALERELLRKLGGGCRMPVGVLAEVNSEKVKLSCAICSPDGKKLLRGELSAASSEADRLVERMANDLLDGGADKILKELTP